MSPSRPTTRSPRPPVSTSPTARRRWASSARSTAPSSPGEAIRPNVKDAAVASEDASFYENRGVSPRGIVRALINNLRGGDRQGASKITQQYVERYHTGNVTSYVGKAREAVMALKTDP